MEDKKPHILHIGTVTNTEIGKAVDAAGNLETTATFTVEGVDPEHLKATFGGSIVNGEWVQPE